MEWEPPADLVRIVSPLALAHSAIGLGIVGVVMWMRADNTLKLFGIGMGLFAAGLGIAAVTMAFRPAEDSIRWFAVVGGILTLGAAIVFLRVGVEDWSLNWRRVAMVGALIWAIVLLVLELVVDAGGRAEYSKAGFIVTNIHAVTAMWLIVGLVFAFFEAAHIAVEHSHGEPYRSILLGAMSIMALTIVITTIADNDALRFINSITGTIASGIMWVAVVKHERAEIMREREEMTRRLTEKT